MEKTSKKQIKLKLKLERKQEQINNGTYKKWRKNRSGKGTNNNGAGKITKSLKNTIQALKKVCHNYQFKECSDQSCIYLHEPQDPPGFCAYLKTCSINHQSIECKAFLARNCENGLCEYRHNYSRLNQEANNTEFSRRLTEINSDLLVLDPLEQRVMENTDLDLMFIMDITGSMASWIEAAKKELFYILDFVNQSFPKTHIRISFVGYRDYCDRNRFSILNFTEDRQVAKDFIAKQQASGGGDTCEDVAGGLNMALQQSWYAKTRYAVLVLDAPPHGKQYYEGKVGDDHPAGDPDGFLIEETIAQFCKNQIVLYGIQIVQNYTQKFFSLISQIYQQNGGAPVEIANLGKCTETFGFVIANSVSNTVSQTITSSTGNKDIKELRKALRQLRAKRQQTLMQSQSISFPQIIDEFDEMKEYSNESEEEPKDIEEIDFDDITSEPSFIQHQQAINEDQKLNLDEKVILKVNQETIKTEEFKECAKENQPQEEKINKVHEPTKIEEGNQKDLKTELQQTEQKEEKILTKSEQITIKKDIEQEAKKELNFDQIVVKNEVSEENNEKTNQIDQTTDKALEAKEKITETKEIGPKISDSEVSLPKTTITQDQTLSNQSRKSGDPVLLESSQNDNDFEIILKEQVPEIKPVEDKLPSQNDGFSEKSVILLTNQELDPNKVKLPEKESPQVEKVKLLKLKIDESQKLLWELKNFSSESGTINAVCYTCYIVKDKNMSINWKKPLIQKSQIKTTIKIAQKPFSKGAMRFAFYMYDKFLDQKMVAKLPIKIDARYSLEEMSAEIETIVICQHIVNEFNNRMVNYVQEPNILQNFVHSFIYEILDPKFPFKLYYGENFIQGKYEKFNNNAGWMSGNMNSASLVAQALSHYSWQITKGYLMMVDIQGSCGVLTDPQIHCLDYNRFGKGNLGYEGIVKFFLSHNCNYYCKKLNLINPKVEASIPLQFNFYLEELEKPKIPNEMITKLCDLCRQSFKMEAIQIYNRNVDNLEFYCKTCDDLKLKTIKSSFCVDCKEEFQTSEYWFKMKRTEFPNQCRQCRLKDRNNKRNELTVTQ